MALNINGVEPTEIKFVDSSGQAHTPNIYTYATTGDDLKEATRSGVSSYTSTQLNGWVGKENDTWSGITNASKLEANKYYYLRVYVSDTQKYGKFCVMFKSVSGTTITVDNKGWGYDGEVIYSTPVWGKPYSLVLKGSNCEVLAYRNTSPNQHASSGTLTGGGTVYYGDTVQISITPKTLAQYELTSVKINGTEQLSSNADSFTKTIIITSNIIISATGEKKTPKLTAATVSGSFTYDSSLGNYALKASIYNPNSVTVLANINIYSNGGVLDTSLSRSILAKGTITVYSTTTLATNAAKISVVISSSGYGNEPETVQTFGNYTEETEETTTTTTTE